jgi:hypothetical protein
MNIVKSLVLGVIAFGLLACANKVPSQGMQKGSVTDPALMSTVSKGRAEADERVCDSTVLLDIQASNYIGPIIIEFRKGSRPGSKKLQAYKIDTRGVVTIDNVCSGKYFFSFATPDSPSVSVTRYFDVVNMESQRSTTKITVTYSRKSQSGNRVERVGRGQL